MLQVKREPSETSPIPHMYGSSPMYPGASPGPPSPHSTPSPIPYTYGNFNLLRHNTGGGLVEIKSPEMNPFKQDVSYQVPGTSKQTIEPPPMPYPNIFPSTSPLNDLSDSNLYVQQGLTSPNIFMGKIGSTNIGTGNIAKVENDTSRSQFPAQPGGSTMLDMDSQQYSLELSLGNLDSGELTRMAMSVTAANLSENLSSNLTLDEKAGKSAMECDQGNMTDSLTRVANEALQELVSYSDMNQSSQQ